MNKLTPKQLILLNQKIVEDDAAVVTDEGMAMLEEIAEIPYEKNEELFYICKDAVEKAAVLGILIAERKPFSEANKETAVLALLTLLEINECKLKNYSKKEDIEELCECLIHAEREAVCGWINAHKENDRRDDPI